MRRYINGLPIPWTLSTFMHAFFPRDANAAKPGRDFYGRRSSSMWFHLPIEARKWISSLMLFALVVQIPDAICHAFWYSYLQTQAWPGALVTNIWLVVQLSCQIGASCIENKAKARVRAANPTKFPPVVSTYLREALRRWRSETPEGQKMCRHIFYGEHSFISFIRAELQKYKQQAAKFGDVDGLTGIHVSEVKRESHYGSSGVDDLRSMFKSAGHAASATQSLAAMSKRSTAKVAPQA